MCRALARNRRVRRPASFAASHRARFRRTRASPRCSMHGRALRGASPLPLARAGRARGGPPHSPLRKRHARKRSVRATDTPRRPPGRRSTSRWCCRSSRRAYARAAEAVRAGLPGRGGRPPAGGATRVFAHGDDGVLTAFEAAQRAGARVIVGPLLRDDLKIVAAMALDLPFTIALNQLDEGGADRRRRSTRSRCRSRATRASSRAAFATFPERRARCRAR